MQTALELLRGVVERITYHNEENGYTVAKLLPEVRPRHLKPWEQEVAVVGNMVGVTVGESVELQGRWVVHGEYGRQFAVEQMRTVLPATVAGIEKYLGSGLIKGVGPVTAHRIVGCFGADTLEIIDQAPQRLIEVPGVGRKRVTLIQAAWQEQRAIKEVMLFLQSHGVSTGLATRIYKCYGDAAVATVQQDPYQLAQDIYGIGFATADKIAQALGLAADAPQRIAAGIAHLLGQATEDGHVFLPSRQLLAEAAQLLTVTAPQVEAGLARLWMEDRVKLVAAPGALAQRPPFAVSPVHAPAALTGPNLAEAAAPYSAAAPIPLPADPCPVYLTPLYYSEVGVASGVQRLALQGRSRLPRFAAAFAWEAVFAALERRNGLRLASQQQRAVQTALTHRLTILTGGPGTGKTTSVRTLLQLCEAEGYRALLAAPTGRAAKRLAETSEREARTLHRLLEFKPTEGLAFKRNEESPLEGDLLIVDEASMLDMVLTNHLLKAVPAGMHLLLVGDVDQLPSVGAGSVLKDLIGAIEGQPEESGGRTPGLQGAAVVRLETIFRQDPGSFIITNAHRINQGQMPLIDNEQARDFFFFKVNEPERAAQLCVELVQSRIPRRFGLATADIQLLTPMHRGVAGVAALNEALQAALNPPAAQKVEWRLGSRLYRVGDRVMQLRNNYDKEVYNGDMGVVQAMDPVLQRATIRYDSRFVEYDYLELGELTHAYAVSVHKSQGSEYPAVVLPVLTSHFMLLQRNLLYTAVTRARQLVVLVGQPKAVAIAVRNHQVGDRFTGLRERLLL